MTNSSLQIEAVSKPFICYITSTTFQAMDRFNPSSFSIFYNSYNTAAFSEHYGS
jgi:hypothetical protein